jgi:hypothetical protein
MRNSFCVLFVLLAGCLPKPAQRDPYYANAPDRPAVPAEQVQELHDLSGVGIAVDQTGVPVIPPNYPTAEDPHVVLGEVLAATSGNQPLPHDEGLARAVAAASRHGGNAVYQGRRNATAVYWVFHLSSAEPVFGPAAPLLDRLEKDYGRVTYHRYGSDLVRKLDTFDRIKLPAQSATCYRAAVALDADARFAQDIGIQLALLVDEHGKTRDVSVPVRRPLPMARSFLIQLGCYANSTGVSWTLARGRETPAMGTGKVVVRTFAMPLTADQRRRWCADLTGVDRRTADAQGLCHR